MLESNIISKKIHFLHDFVEGPSIPTNIHLNFWGYVDDPRVDRYWQKKDNIDYFIKRLCGYLETKEDYFDKALIDADNEIKALMLHIISKGIRASHGFTYTDMEYIIFPDDVIRTTVDEMLEGLEKYEHTSVDNNNRGDNRQF